MRVLDTYLSKHFLVETGKVILVELRVGVVEVLHHEPRVVKLGLFNGLADDVLLIVYFGSLIPKLNAHLFQSDEPHLLNMVLSLSLQMTNQ